MRHASIDEAEDNNMTFNNRQLAMLGTLILLGGSPVHSVQAQETFLGEISWFGYNFCPRGWTEANGQLLSIAQNAALFSLYGTTYGGDGRTTFALPDLRGRVSIHTGQGPGLSDYRLGASGGTESETLAVDQLPAHNHRINVSPGNASYSDGSNGVLAAAGTNKKNTDAYIYDGPGTATEQLAPDAVGDTGAGQSLNNVQPYQVLRACVALEGIYPSQN